MLLSISNLSKEIPLFIPWIFFGMASLLIASFLKLKSADYESIIFQKNASCETLSNLKLLLLYRIMFCLIELGSNLSIHWITSILYCILLRNIVMEYFGLKIASFYKIGFGTIQCTIIRRTNSLCEFLNSFIIKMLPQFLLFVVIFTRIFQLISFKIAINTLIFLIFSISFIIGLHYLRSLLRSYVNKAYEESNSTRIEILESYEKIVSYCCLEEELTKYNDKLERYLVLRHVYTTTYHLISLVSEMLLMGVSVMLISNLIGTESFISVVLLTEKLKDTIYIILQEIETVLMDYSNYGYTNYKEVDVDNDSEKALISAFRQEIDVANMTVEIGSRRIFDNVTFKIKKGEKVAITGLNGSGKSILMNLIFGMVDYQGSIKIDGVELKNIQRKSLVELISYVTQNIKVFNSSIKNNLLVGDDVDDDEMIQVCEKYGCHGLFKELGYNKVIGDRGKMISGGQRQRIILLRGIIRDKDVLLVDGAFTGLDQMTEEMFIKAFNENMNEKTVVCSTQNTSMLPYFDEVIFISNGKILKGPYCSLIKNSSDFRRFCQVKKINKIDFGRIAKKMFLSPIK